MGQRGQGLYRLFPRLWRTRSAGIGAEKEAWHCPLTNARRHGAVTSALHHSSILPTGRAFDRSVAGCVFCGAGGGGCTQDIARCRHGASFRATTFHAFARCTLRDSQSFQNRDTLSPGEQNKSVVRECNDFGASRCTPPPPCEPMRIFSATLLHMSPAHLSIISQMCRRQQTRYRSVYPLGFPSSIYLMCRSIRKPKSRFRFRMARFKR